MTFRNQESSRDSKGDLNYKHIKAALSPYHKQIRGHNTSLSAKRSPVGFGRDDYIYPSKQQTMSLRLTDRQNSRSSSTSSFSSIKPFPNQDLAHLDGRMIHNFLEDDQTSLAISRINSDLFSSYKNIISEQYNLLIEYQAHYSQLYKNSCPSLTG